MKKPRDEWTYISSSEQINSLSFRYDPSTDTIEVNFPIDNAFREISYKRKKGHKTLSKVPLSKNKLYLNDESNLVAYDLIIAIDTTTKIIKSDLVSITGITVLNWLNESEYSYSTPFCIAFTNLREPQEKIGWLAGMQKLQLLGRFKKDSNILLVVDAYLGELDAINKRTAPIYKNVYLPQGFDICYASSDTGAEYVTNKLIRNSDKISNTVMKYIADNEITNWQTPIKSELYDTYNVIMLKNP